MSTLENSRVWFITGSSQGLGRALLEAVLTAGERAVATVRKPGVLAPLQSKYPVEQLLVVIADVTNKAQIAEAFEATKEKFGRLDVAVNNAGYGLFGESEALPEEEARKQVEVMFWAPVDISHRAVKFMRDINPPGHGGLILNISSAGGYSANPCLAFYSAGKFALEGFTEALRKEMVPSWNIRVMVIQPGGFSTSWADSSMVNYPAPAAYAAPDTPSSQFRAMLNHHKASFTGNPARFAAAVMKLADIDGAQLPLRVQLGSDALGLVKNKALRTIDDGKKWADISHSTNNDGIDKDFILDQLAAANY